jgi:hypothetical protein
MASFLIRMNDFINTIELGSFVSIRREEVHYSRRFGFFGLVVRDEDRVFELVHRRASADLSCFGLLALVRSDFGWPDCMS